MLSQEDYLVIKTLKQRDVLRFDMLLSHYN